MTQVFVVEVSYDTPTWVYRVEANNQQQAKYLAESYHEDKRVGVHSRVLNEHTKEEDEKTDLVWKAKGWK